MEIVNCNHTLNFVLAKRIVQSPSMTGCIIYGGQRIGKSTYALKVMYDVYRDWNIVLDHVFFRIEDIIKCLRDAIRNDKLVPIILLDDCGVHCNKQLYFTNKDLTMYLGALMDTIGTSCKGLLMTVPNPESVLKSIRGYEFYRVKITRANSGYDRIATGYRNILLPSGDTNISKEFKDTYNTILKDNDAYNRYTRMRKSYLNEALDNLETAINKKMNIKQQIKEEM